MSNLRTLTYVVKMDIGDGKQKAKDFRVTLKTMEQDATKASKQVNELAQSIGKKYATNVKVAVDQTKTVSNEIRSAAREASRAEKIYEKLTNEYALLSSRTGKTAEEQEVLNAQYRLGVNATKAQKDQVAQLVTAYQAQRKEANKTQGSMRNLKGQAQNLGWQLQDVAVQAQMGTSALVILGQQGSQLASGFGAKGALIGAGIAVGAAAMGVLSKASGEANIKVKELADTSRILADNFKELSVYQRSLLGKSLQESFKEKTKEANALQIKINKLDTALINANRSASGRFLEKMLGDDPQKINNELIKAKATLVALNIERKKIKEQLKDPSGKKEDDKSSDKEKTKNLEEFISSLSKSALMFGANDKEIAKYEASLLGANEAQIKVVSNLYDIIEAKEADIEATKKAVKEAKEAEKQFEKDLQTASNYDPNIKLALLERQYLQERKLLEGNFKALENLEKHYTNERIKINGSFWQKYAVSAQENLGSFDDQVSNSLDRFSSGFGEALSNAVFESDGLGEAMANIFKDVGKNMVAFFAEWAAQKLTLWALDQAIDKSAGTSKATTMTLDAQAMSVQAGLNAFASTAAIPIVGASLAPEAATAAVAATQPMAATVSSLAFAGLFDKGGFIPSGSSGIVSEFGDELVGGTMVYNNSPNSLKVTGREETARSNGGVSIGGITINSSGNASPDAIARSLVRAIKKGGKQLDNAVFASTNRGKTNKGKRYA